VKIIFIETNSDFWNYSIFGKEKFKDQKILIQSFISYSDLSLV